MIKQSLDFRFNYFNLFIMEKVLKTLIKEAVIEALNEFANGGVAVASEGEADEKPKKPKKKPLEPESIFGPSGFSLK